MRKFPSPLHAWLAYLMHDLGSPLARITTVIAPLEMLEHTNVRVTKKELILIGHEVRRALTEAQALLSGVSNNLSLDEVSADFVPFALHTQVEQVLERVRMDAVSKEIELRYKPGNRDLMVEGDASLIGRAIRNIIGNAIEYSPASSVIEIETRLTERDVSIVISDNGPGIPQGSMQWLFEPGFRVGERRAKLDGRGLGLAFVRRVIDLHKGRVTVDSSPAVGTRFLIELPLSGSAD